MPILSHYREYNVWLKGCCSGAVRERTRTLLNIAYARLRIADRFESVRIHQVSPSLVQGYSAGVRLLLC